MKGWRIFRPPKRYFCRLTSPSRDTPLRRGQLPLDEHNLTLDICVAVALRCKPRGRIRIPSGHNSLFDKIEHVLDGAIHSRALGPECFEMSLTVPA